MTIMERKIVLKKDVMDAQFLMQAPEAVPF